MNASQSKIINKQDKFNFVLKRFGLCTVFFTPLIFLNFLSSPSFVLYQLTFIGLFLFYSVVEIQLAKNILRRFKIYLRANSTVDRFVYQLVVGHIGFSLGLFLINFLSDQAEIYGHIAILFLALLFYCWPNSNRINNQRLNSSLIEFKFLDGFEKTVLVLILVIFAISFPKIPDFTEIDSLKLFIDKDERVHRFIWNQIFLRYQLSFDSILPYNYVTIAYFYFHCGSIFLISAYSLFRFVYSRRIAILGVFSIVSSWYFSLLFFKQPHQIHATFGALLIVTGAQYVINSSSYRVGFIFGFFSLFASLFTPQILIPSLILFTICLLKGFKRKSLWFKQQAFKYSLLGFILGTIFFLLHSGNQIRPDLFVSSNFQDFVQNLFQIATSKSYFFLAILGCMVVIYNSLKSDNQSPEPLLNAHNEKLLSCISFFGAMFLFMAPLDPSITSGLFSLTAVSFLALIPVEGLIHELNQWRSRRSLVYGFFILVCLLDSRIEGRIKILLENFL